MGEAIRTTDGRFLARNCSDPNCDGSLIADFDEAWFGAACMPIYRCDGLTHISDNSALFACEVTHPRALATEKAPKS